MKNPQSDSGAALYDHAPLFEPDPQRTAATTVGTAQAFDQLLTRSWQNPEDFWADMAKELQWIKPWSEVRRGRMPDCQWFCGGIANPCVNMLKRHLEAGADNRVALIWEGEEGERRFYTYRMLYHEVNRFANVMKRFGVGKGDGVAIFLPNLAETVISVLACYLLGAVFNTVFSGFSANALRARLESFAPKLLITADGAKRRGKAIQLKTIADEATKGLPTIQAQVVVRRIGLPLPMHEGRDWWWDDLMSTAPAECDPEPLEANEPGLVFYTSGTTGKPKGVVHAGMAFVVNNYVYCKYQMDHRPQDVLWCTADIGWLTMHIWGIVGALTNGLTTIFYEGALDHPTPARFYEIVERYRVNKIFTAPTVLRMLMKHGHELPARYDLSALEVLSLVGEPFNPEAWHWTYENLGRKHIYINNTWGQTELAGCPLAGAAWLTSMKPGSCGKRYLAANVDVVDEAGNSLPPNTPGSLVLRDAIPMMVRTLWREPERFIREYFSQIPGCYFAYDLAVKDSDGHFWVLGRLDDVINVAGHRLSTMEIESAIMGCPHVAEVAVIGFPDDLKGLVPVAFVTLKAGSQPSASLREKIREIVSESISKIAAPSEVYFTEVMPKTASGKIMRRLLKEILVHGETQGDMTGLEDTSTVEKIQVVVAEQRKTF